MPQADVLNAYLAVFLQDLRGDFSSLLASQHDSLNICAASYLLDELNHGTCLEFGTSLAEFLKSDETGIRVAKNTVAVSEECEGKVDQQAIMIHTLGRLDRFEASSKGIP